MKYCSNCGAEINENAVVCVKCGAAVQSAINKPDNSSNGNSKASLVLGIIAIIFGALSFIITLCVNAYLTGTIEGRLQRYATDFGNTKIGLYMLLIPVPAILSVIGFFLGIANKNKNGSNKAGLVLNIITIFICIIEIIMISGL